MFAHVRENPSLQGCRKGDAVKYDLEWDPLKRKYQAVGLILQDSNRFGGGLKEAERRPTDVVSPAAQAFGMRRETDEADTGGNQVRGRDDGGQGGDAPTADP